MWGERGIAGRDRNGFHEKNAFFWLTEGRHGGFSVERNFSFSANSMKVNCGEGK